MPSQSNIDSTTQILHREDLPLGGFNGLREHQVVTDQRLFGHHKHPLAANGLGNFVYLADARFVPQGETGMHPHQKIDVISVMIEGRIAHAGSLHEGEDVIAPAVQVQRSGDEGFTHNEVNPDDKPNRMIQLWFLPEHPSQGADYQIHQPKLGTVTRVYGGSLNESPNSQNTFPSTTTLDIAHLTTQQTIEIPGPFIAYITQGNAQANGQAVTDGDLIQGENLTLAAHDNTQAIIISLLD